MGCDSKSALLISVIISPRAILCWDFTRWSQLDDWHALFIKRSNIVTSHSSSNLIQFYHHNSTLLVIANTKLSDQLRDFYQFNFLFNSFFIILLEIFQLWRNMNELKQTTWESNETCSETIEGFEQSANWIENLKHYTRTTLLEDLAGHMRVSEEQTTYEGLSTKLNIDSVRHMRLWGLSWAK